LNPQPPLAAVTNPPVSDKMPIAYLTYSAFVEMFEPSLDCSAYEDDGNIEIDWRDCKCKNPARQSSGDWAAFLWRPASDLYEGKLMRMEYNTSSPFAFWWSDIVENDEV